VDATPAESLLAHRERFLSFVRARVSDRVEAEDLLQSAYTRAVEHAVDVPIGRELPWFYRVLRNAIIDRHRRRDVDRRRREAWEKDPTREPDSRPPGRLCRCTVRALASLKPQYIQIIEAVDVRGRSVVDFADSSGITTTNAYVRLHRARRLLGDRLRALCQRCADTACVDCHCKGS
jgi:RNA polymerase sigma factor (sigma-70 family)